MSRHHDLTERMADIAQRPDTATDGEIEELSEEFSEYCTETNSRLREIRQLLGKGRRAEAVTRAQRDPDLLELVMALDFLYLTRWNELCLRHNVPLAPLLSLETAGALNEAYTAQQPLEGLLRQHRLLALAKGSLRDRLLVLRQISEKDTNVQFWKEDIATLEKSRVLELESDVDAAGAKKDLTAIANLHREINNTQWLVTIPEVIETKVSNMHRVLRRQSLVAGFEIIVTNLNVAYEKGNLGEMKKLLATAEDTAVQIQPPVESELYSQLDAPRQAIMDAASQDEIKGQFDIAIDKLRQALRTNISKENLVTYRTSLESKISAAEQYGLVIPEAIVVQARRKLKEIESQQKRDFVFKILAVSFTCVVLAAGVAGIVIFLNASSARQAQVDKFATLYAQKDYQRIIVEYDKLQNEGSSYADDLEILKMQEEARTRLVATQGKTLRLKGLVESLETNGVKVYSQADVDEARALAEELEDLDMIARLDKFQLERDQYLNMSAQETQEAYEEEYRRITIEIDKLSLEGALITNDKLNEVKGDLELLQDDYPDNANDKLLESRLSQIADLRTQMKTNMDFDGFKKELAVASGNATQYADALRNLEKFLLDNPAENAEMKNDIEFVLLESNYWTGVVDWAQFFSVQFQPGLIIKSPLKLAAEQARTAIDQGTKLQQMYPEFEEYKSAYLDRKDMLISITERPQADIVGLLSDIRTYIGDTEAVLIATEANQKVTYNLQDLTTWAVTSAKKQGGKYVITHFTNIDNDTDESGFLERDLNYYGPAPHPIIKKKLTSVLDTLNGSGKSWEVIFMDAIDALFDDEIVTFQNQLPDKKEIKQVVSLSGTQRLMICRELLDMANMGSEILDEEVAKANEALQLADVELLDFVAPTGSAERLQNKKASDALDELKGKLDQSRPTVLRKLEEFSNTTKKGVIWVGWIDLRDGGYTVRFSEGKPKSGPMFTVISNGTDRTDAKIIELGNANGGVLQIPENTAGSNFKHRFGRPVFTYTETTTKE